MSADNFKKEKESLTKELSFSAFGKGSFFDKIKEYNVKYLFLGIPMQYATFIHHIEEDLAVPYRFVKDFKGKIQQENNIEDITIPVFSRYLDLNVKTSLKRLEDSLCEKNLVSIEKLGRGKLMMVDLMDFYRGAKDLYTIDSFSFLDRSFTEEELNAARKLESKRG